MVSGYFIIQMEKLKQKENSEVVWELGNGDIITSLVKLSSYQATLNLVRERGNGLNMMRTEKWQEYLSIDKANFGIIALIH